MQMLAVVPGDECQHPLPRQVDVLESMRRVAWRVLAGAEPGFDMGIVVRDAGAAVRRRDAQRLQFGLERVRLLRRAVVGVQHQRLVVAAAFAPASPFHQRGRLVAALACMHFPGDQLAAEQVDDGVQIEEHTAHLAGQIRHVPAPHLVGAVGYVALRLGGLRRLGPAAMLLLLCRAQYAIERRFGRQIGSLVGQTRHDLCRWQVGEARLVADVEHALAFLLAQLVCRRRPRRRRSRIGLDLARAAPARDGARTQTHFGTGQTQRGTILAGLLNIGDQLLALRQRNHASSPSVHSASYFRDSTSSAAVSANAFSLRRKSLSSSRMRFLSVARSVAPARFCPVDKAVWTSVRQRSSCSTSNPLRRQYAANSAAFRGAASSTPVSCATATTGLLCGALIWLSACSFFSLVYFVIVKSIAPRLIGTLNAGGDNYF